MVEDTTKIGVPIYLAGTLQEKFIPKESYINEGSLPSVNDSYSWRMGWLNTDEIPEKLYLINKNKKVDFDYYLAPNGGGFIISEAFKNIFDAQEHPNYIATTLEVVNRNGEKNTTKQYWYIVIKEDVEAVDFGKSQLNQIVEPDGRFGIRFPSILKYGSRLVLNSELFHPKDIFFIYQPYLRNYLFCNEATKQEILDNKIKTIRFIELKNFVSYFNEQYVTNNVFRQMKLIVE